MRTVIFDTDDLSIENNIFYYLDRIKEMLPNFKVSAFFIPFDYVNYPLMQDFEREDVIAGFKKRDWIELIPHGLLHKPREFENVGYEDFDVIFKGIDEVFKTYDLPYVKGFKAPQWLYNEDLVRFLDERGWWLATDRNQPDAPQCKRNYVYTHSLDEEYWRDDGEIRLHSHVSLPSSNNIPDCITSFQKLQPETEFKFISEVI